MRKWVRGAFLVGLIGVAREDIILHDDVKGEVPTYYEQIKMDLEKHEDPYLKEARSSCFGDVPSTWDCIKYEVLERFEGFLSADHRLGEHAMLSKSSRSIDHSQAEGRSLSGLAGYLARKAWTFAAGTDLVIEFPRELTGGDVMAPRFIDEVFNEFDTIDNKHEKPQIRNQLKKLFIPLLIILKIFKLKLLFLLPLILGVASFKKLIGFLAILIPGVIGYLKLCRSGSDYGAHGHSNYYNRPPHRRQDHEYTTGNGDEPYSSEFADIHPDYLPDYLQESSKPGSKFQKGSSQSSSHSYQHQSGTYPSSQGNPNYQSFQQNSNYQTHREDFWKTHPDYLPYRGYYSQQQQMKTQ